MDDWQYERNRLILSHDTDDFPQTMEMNLINALDGVETWISSPKASATLGGKNGMAARFGAVLSRLGYAQQGILIVAFCIWRPW
jgi:hypothetical protein